MSESMKEKDIEEHPYVKWLEKKLENAQKEVDRLKELLLKFNHNRKSLSPMWREAG